MAEKNQSMAFAYEARDHRGELVSGIVNALDMSQAGATLSQRNLFVVKIAPADRKAAKAKKGFGSKKGQRVPRKSVLWFISQLTIMTETGIPISQSLEILARREDAGDMQKIIKEVSKNVHAGQPLSEALEEYPIVFPTTMTALIRASEMSGTLPSVLKRISVYMMKEHQIIRAMRSALIYPGFMLLLSLAITVFLLTVILPKFADIFAAKGAILPLPTQILMNLSDLLINHWLYWLIGTFAVVYGIRLWALSISGKLTLHRLQLSVPVFSTVFNKMYQSRSFRAMGTLIESGVPLTDALAITKEMSTNAYYHELWDDITQAVTHGETISKPMSKSPLIPEEISQMVEAGDHSGSLGIVFERLAEFLEEEFDQAVKTATQFIEPLTIMVMGSVVGFVAISLLLPLFQSGNVMAK